MSLLSTYVCRYFLRFFIAGLLLCVALFVLIELFDRLDEFIERQVLWWDAVRYVAYKLPGMVYQMIPAACLLASVLTFSTLSRHQEITAMRAAGVSPLRLARPLVLLGAMASLAMLVAQVALVPTAIHAANVTWRTRIRQVKLDLTQGLFKQGQIWYRSTQRIWRIQHSLPLQQRFLGVTIYELDATGAIQQRYDAAEAQWQGQGWILRHGICHRFDASGTFSGLPDAFVERRLHFPERPAEISAVRRQPEELGLWDIRDYGRHLARQGIHTPLYEVEFHGRLAFAAVCMMMAGCGLPLALHSNRQGGTIRAVALTLLGGFSYWMLHALAMALGQNGHLPPVLAAWSANGCFGAGSLYLAARLR